MNILAVLCADCEFALGSLRLRSGVRGGDAARLIQRPGRRLHLPDQLPLSPLAHALCRRLRQLHLRHHHRVLPLRQQQRAHVPALSQPHRAGAVLRSLNQSNCQCALVTLVSQIFVKFHVLLAKCCLIYPWHSSLCPNVLN